jgi:hypothetical protein
MSTSGLDRPADTPTLSRRDFVCTAVDSGFAAAVLPVAAQTEGGGGGGWKQCLAWFKANGVV